MYYLNNMKNGKYILVKAPEGYPGKLYRNKYCYEHHLNYWLHYKVLPKYDEIIHHKDENTHNNIIENLILLKREQHSKDHRKIGRKFVLIECPGCKNTFEVEKRSTFLQQKSKKYTCCCRKCSGIFSSFFKKNKEEATQIIKNSVKAEYVKNYSA